MLTSVNAPDVDDDDDMLNAPIDYEEPQPDPDPPADSAMQPKV